MRAMSRPNKTVAALVALTAIPVLSHVAPPAAVGAVALSAAVLAAVAPGGARRLDLIATAAIWGMVAAMFGLTGVGFFAVAQVFVACAVILIQRLLPPTAALALVTALSALLAACGATYLSALLGPEWAQAGPVLVIMAIGAPGVMLQRVASALRGGERAEQERLVALGPQLVAMALGGGMGGIAGVAATVAIAALAMPLASLLLPGPRAVRRMAAAFRALGIMAAGFVCCAAIVVALRFAEGREAAMLPAIGLGLLAGLIALRVHTPGAAKHLAVLLAVPRAVTPVTEMAETGN
jgi:hypothetical protein